MWSKYKVLAVSQDRHGKEFIAIAESYKYPFYGTQFHTEKNEFDNFRDVKKSGVDISRHFSKFFVAESKKNKNFATNEIKNYIITENFQE